MAHEEFSDASPPVVNDAGQEEKSFLPKVFLFLAIVSVAALTFLVLWGGRDELRKVQPGYPAPEFTFRDLDYKEVSLSDYKGSVVLLNIWSTTCPPCVEEVPYLENLFRQMKDVDGFHLLTIVSNRGEDENAVKPFMEKNGLHFHTLIDTKKIAWRKYKLTGWPETFLMDKEGIIIEKYIGPRNWDSPEFVEKFKDLAGKVRHEV